MEFLNLAPNAEFTPGNHILSKDDATPGDAVEHARIKKNHLEVHFHLFSWLTLDIGEAIFDF